MKTVGVLGGLGPETTAQFYMSLIRHGQSREVKARPPILIWSVPIPYAVEQSCVLHGRGYDEMLPLLLEGARRLEQGGADFLVMPCNSLHIFINAIREKAQVPVLSIVEETIKWLAKEEAANVGLLGTAITIEHGLYQGSFEKAGVKYLLPDPAEQLELQRIIFSTITGQPAGPHQYLISRITETFRERRVSHILLACTDLQLFFPDTGFPKVVDTMAILARSAAAEIFE